MSEVSTIHQALAEVNRALKAVPKADRNEQQKYNFRGIDSIMTAVHPHLAAEGVVVTPIVEDVHYDKYTTRNGAEMRVAVVTVRYRFHGPAGDYVDAVVVGEASDSADKATNKALSAAFKYALVQTFTLPTDEPDPDEHHVERVATPAAEPAPELTDLQAKVRDAMADLADDQIATLKGLWDESAVPKRFSAMSDEQAAQALAWVDEATAPPFDPPSAAQQSEAKELLTKLDVLDDEFVPATWLDAGFGVQGVEGIETRQDMDRAIGKLRELVAKAEGAS